MTSLISATSSSTQKRLTVQLDETAFGCFMVGSSAIADVDATLVYGAQRTRSLNLFFFAASAVGART